ncbi:hypothetical protein EDB89DRAFT_2026490 [Lactarius sanguifluus]|nr:hypothetical protein EDB89DRAFT_2026490 [Lactarius sanguifluus]
MSPPTAPITSTSSARSKKQKKPTEKRAKKSAKVAAPASSSDAEDRTMLAPEGVDPTPAYVPPAGSVPADLDQEGAELWLVRAPTAVKAKNLQGIQSRKSTAGGDRHHQPHVGAEELNGLSVLLPRKRKGGKLFLAPKPVARHLVVAARPAEPMRRDAAEDPATFQNPPREAYPDEALTHRFRPYGDLGDPPPPPPEDQMDLGVDDNHAEEGGAREKERERRKKRRGGDAVESPKKAKKAKTAAS